MNDPVRFSVAGLVACLALVTGCGNQETKSEDKSETPADSTVPSPSPSDKPLIAVVRAADWMGSEWSEDAIKVGLRESDMEPGRDYQLKLTSAQGDLTALPNLIDAAVDAKAKVIVTLQDATLQVAVQRVKSIPIVFHLLADPFAAGAGKSDSDHLPNVTGVYSPGFGDPEQTRRVELIRRIIPRARHIGVLFSPQEALSVTFKDRLTKAAQDAKMQVTAWPVTDVRDVGDMTRALCNFRVDAIEMFGNVAHAGFASLIRVANTCRIPVFSSSPFEVVKGAVASIFPEFNEGGVEAGKMIAKVLRGASPGSIPFYQVRKVKLAVNPSGVSKFGLKVPPDVVKQADTVVGDTAMRK